MTINTHLLYRFIKHFFTARRNGHGIHSPFAYQLCEEVFYNRNSFYDLDALKKLRAGLKSNESMLEIQDFGAGSKTFTGNRRKIKDIVAKGTSTVKQSEILYKLINFLSCRHSVELGTSIGINTLYMAKSNTNGLITTIEGSKALFEFASALAAKNNIANINYIHGKFDDALTGVLKQLPSLDLLYVDGNHTYEATLRYFEMALQYKHNASVFIFDDIYWSPGMTKAWEALKGHPEVTLSIDAFYFGMLFFKPEIKEKIAVKLFI